MKGLISIVRRRLIWLAVVMILAVLLVAILFQIISVQNQARADSVAMFEQVRTVLAENQTELEKVKAEYSRTCLLNADVISTVIEGDPTMLTTAEDGAGLYTGTDAEIERFNELARKLEIDEIHIFDDKGRIFTGTHREYFNYTVYDGAQIGFFKQMLNDKNARLCQDIMPNTADERVVQYSAVWSNDGKYIIQVGMYPDAVAEATAKNELSYIFSLLSGNAGVTLYAFDMANGRIVGSTTTTDNGRLASDIGLNLKNIERYKDGTHVTVNGVKSFCIMESIEGNLVGYIISNDSLYSPIDGYTILLALCIALIAAVIVFVVQGYINSYIVGSISETNARLRSVTAGNLDEKFEIATSREFAELSTHINTMVSALLADTDKMSLVLNRTNLHIGVYEYTSASAGKVRYTEHVPEIFELDRPECDRIFGDWRELRKFVDELRRYPLEGVPNTYRYSGNTEMYIALEEIVNGSDVLGIVMDVTEETVSRMRAEAERDIDLMTGIYNRRGMERRFEEIFSDTKAMGCGAIIMIDSDNLKDVNDNYGHATGDIYLKELADILRNFEAPKKLYARIGGDEFVLMIYGYRRDGDVQDALNRFGMLRDSAEIDLPDGSGKIPLRFSYGYELTRARRDYEAMLSTADAYMYNSKRARKSEHLGENKNQ